MSASEKNKNASSIWGGRFDGGVSAVMERINASIGFDREMYRQDIAGSRAMPPCLSMPGSSQQRMVRPSNGLTQIEAEIEAGTFTFSPALEDIHMNIENRLVELVGEPGRRLIRHDRAMIRWQPTCGCGPRCHRWYRSCGC